MGLAVNNHRRLIMPLNKERNVGNGEPPQLSLQSVLGNFKQWSTCVLYLNRWPLIKSRYPNQSECQIKWKFENTQNNFDNFKVTKKGSCEESWSPKSWMDMFWFGWVLGHINYCWLFNAIFFFYTYKQFYFRQFNLAKVHIFVYT